jgi:hypothetical protein
MLTTLAEAMTRHATSSVASSSTGRGSVVETVRSKKFGMPVRPAPSSVGFQRDRGGGGVGSRHEHVDGGVGLRSTAGAFGNRYPPITWILCGVWGDDR